MFHVAHELMNKPWVSPTIIDTHCYSARYWLDPEAPLDVLRMIRGDFLSWHLAERARLHRLARDNRMHGWLRWPMLSFCWLIFWIEFVISIENYRSYGADRHFSLSVFFVLFYACMTVLFWRRRHWPWEQYAEARMKEALQLDITAGIFLNAIDTRITELEPDA